MLLLLLLLTLLLFRLARLLLLLLLTLLLSIRERTNQQKVLLPLHLPLRPSASLGLRALVLG